jgi:hypothetical protein
VDAYIETASENMREYRDRNLSSGKFKPGSLLMQYVRSIQAGRLQLIGAEIASDPRLEAARLADVKNLAFRSQHPVDARPRGQCADEGLGVEVAHRRMVS